MLFSRAALPCKDGNRAHASRAVPANRASAQLKLRTWRVLRQLRCSPHRAFIVHPDNMRTEPTPTCGHIPYR